MNRLSQAFAHEMTTARMAFARRDFPLAFHHLERAHILGQRSFSRHWISHWWMLKVGLRTRDGREIAGQILRLLAVVPGFVLGWIPLGNTGGANVSAVRPMALPDDLAATLGPVNVWADVALRLVLVAAVVALLNFL